MTQGLSTAEAANRLRASGREVGAFTNRVLLAVITVSVLIQGALYEFPAVRALFELVPLRWQELALVFALGLIPVTALELAKLLRRGLHSRLAK